MTHPKKGYLILSVLILLIAFSYLSIQIIQNQTFSTQVDKLKYLEIQAKIHIVKIEKYISLNTKEDIESFKLNDSRFLLNISIEELNATESSRYHIYLKSKDEPVALYKMVTK